MSLLGAIAAWRDPVGVGCLDVLHGGMGGHAEDAHGVDGGGGVPGLVKDPVLPHWDGVRSSSPKMETQDGMGDRRAAGSTAVCLVISRWGLRVRGQQRCRSRASQS